MKLRTLSIELQQKAVEEINENPGQLATNLDHIKDWLLKQDHLNVRIDDQLLVNFMRGSKHSLQRTKEKLESYYTFRTIAPEISGNLDPFLPNIQTYLRLGVCVLLPLPKNDPASACTILLRYGRNDPDEVTLLTVLKAASILVDILIHENDNFAVAGINAILDMKGIHPRTAIQATPSLLRKCLYYHGKAYPARLKSIHILNVPKFGIQFVNIFRAQFPKKVVNRFHLYSSNEVGDIYNHLPRSIFPTEYGGDAGPIDDLAEKWKGVVESHADRLVKESNYYSEDAEIKQNEVLIENLFGVEGSFRRLDID